MLGYGYVERLLPFRRRRKLDIILCVRFASKEVLCQLPVRLSLARFENAVDAVEGAV